MLRDRGRAIAAFLLAAVCVSSLASLGASQAPTNRENFNPAFPLAGSCWNDDQCAAGRRCNQDGICVSATSNALPAHAPWSSQQTATTVGVLAGAGCCLIMWIMGAATLDWPAGCNVGQMSEGHAKHLFQWFCCGVCWCIPVALLIALPLGKTQLPTYPDGPGTGGNCTDVGALACDPYYCDVVEQKCHEACAGDGECRGGSVCHEGACVIDQTAKRIPGAREKLVNNWVAWVSASSLAILCFFVCAPLAACFLGEFEYDNPVAKCGAIGFVVVCVIVGGAALGLPLGLATTDIAALFPANGTECASSASCAPYFCNYAVGQCNSRCSTSVECQEGYNCVGGYCLSDVAGDTGSVRTKLLSPGVVVAITLSGACCCALCCGVPAGLDDEEELGLGVGVCVCVVVGLALGLGLGLPTKSVELSPPGNNGTACADIEATICEPYYCDASAHICLDRCSDNSECRGGTTCSFDFRCVVDLSATVKTFRFEGWYAAVLGYGIPLLLFTAIYVGGIKALGINPQHPYTDRVLPKFVGVNVVAFLTCFVVMAILWPILSRSTNVTIPVGVVPDNATTCTGISDSRCFPYYCNMVESQCLGSCAADEECADGYFCSDDLACIEGNYQLPVARYAKRGVWCGVAALLGTMAYGCLMAYGSGLSTERNFNWGVTDERLGLVFWVALCCGGGLALFAILPMTNAWRLHDQFTDANGPSCAFVNDVSCGAYFCDTEGGACYTSCADDYGCKRGFLCDAGACTASGDAARFKTIGIILGGVATAVVLLLAIGPYYCRGHRRRERVRLAERRARAEAELEAFNEQQARIQKVHLSIDPAAPMAYDYSMVSPLAAPGAQAFDFPQPIFENVGGGGAGGGSGGGPDVRDIDPDALPDGPLPNLTLPGTVPPTGSDDTDGTPLPEPVDVAIPPPRSPSDSRPGTSELCSICFAAPSVVRFAGRNCAHGFCDECAKFSLEAIMNADQFPARCPGCLAENPDNDAPEAERSFIPSEIVERLVQRAILTVEFGARFIHLQILKAFAPDEIITCPTCELLSIKPNWGRKGGKDKYVVTCENPECRTEYCGNCLVFQFKHRGLTCKQYADRLQHGDDEATTMLLKSVARPCPNCGVPTIHYRGHACHHIKPGSGCPQCGFHWCFECGMRHPCARQGHTLFCDDNCTCPTCPDCYPGHPCENCDGGGGCPACSGREVINEQWHERQAALRAPTPEPQVAIGFPDAVDVEPIHQFAIGDIDPAFLLAFANGGGMDALDGPELVQLQQQLEAAIAAGLVDPNAVDGGGGNGGGGGGAGEPRGSRSVSTSSSVASCSSDGDGGVDGLVAQLMAMGFDADASMAALAAHNNNVEHAINALL